MTITRMGRAALAMAFSALCGLSAYAVPQSSQASFMSVKDFGAKGDGVADDYDAMQAAAAAICAAAPGSKLIYPPGTYRINRYRIFRGPQPNGVNDVVYRNCHGVTISGYGAKIDVKGDFFQSADFEADGFFYSWRKQVTPFFMLDSTDFRIEGFEMNGNVQNMTKDPRVLEDACAGIITSHSSGYLLRDLNIHHFSVDGIMLGILDWDEVVADKDVRLENVTCHRNGRVGLAVIHVRRAWIVNSVFSDSGVTGAFGSFNPAAGVDVEPDFTLADGVDLATGEIYFLNSTFSGAKGPQLLATFPERVDSVTVYGSKVISSPGAEAAYAAVVAPNAGLVENSTFDLRNGQGVLLGSWQSGAFSPSARVTYANNSFLLGTNDGLVSEGIVPFDFVNNTVDVNAGGPDGSVMMLTGLRTLAGNKFFINSSGTADPNGQTAILTNDTQIVQNNEYRTDLSAPGRFFASDYSTTTSSISGEQYPNAPNFIPELWRNWNPATLYPRATSPASDTVLPRITSVVALALSHSTLISWLTDEPADATVEYGSTTGYGRVGRLAASTRYHPVFLTDLQPNTTIHYRVKSRDAAGNVSVSADATFTVPYIPPPFWNEIPANPSPGRSRSVRH